MRERDHAVARAPAPPAAPAARRGLVPERRRRRGTPSACPAAPHDLAYVIFTSGSTGAQGRDDRAPRRGQHRARRQPALRASGRTTGCSACRRWASTCRSTTCSALLAAGGAVVLPGPTRDARPGALARAAPPRHGVTIWNSVPALMEMLVESARAAGRAGCPRRCGCVLLSGDWIPVDAAGPDPRALAARRRARQPGRRDRGGDLVDHPPDRRGRPGLAQHPLRHGRWPTSASTCSTTGSSRARLGGRRALHRRRRPGARLLARRGADRDALPHPSADRRAPLPDRRPRPVPARRRRSSSSAARTSRSRSRATASSSARSSRCSPSTPR